MDIRAVLETRPQATTLAAADPRLKVLCAFAGIVACAVVPLEDWARVLSMFAVFTLAAWLGRVGAAWLARRLAFVIPMAFFLGLLVVLAPVQSPQDALQVELLGRAVSRTSALASAAIVVKSALCLLIVSVLLGTTSMDEVLVALSAYRVPRLFVALTSLAYRYVFVLISEAERMVRAKNARGSTRGLRRTLGVLAAMTCALFVRTHQRAERIATAMIARGYAGWLPLAGLGPLPRRQAIAAAAFAGLVVAIAVA